MMKYKLFGRSGLRVSEICLGTMTFGTEWGWGADYETSKAIFEHYAAAGGNFIDTANRYTEGSSERYLADFIRHDRHRFVVATKYTLYDQRGDPNYSGNHRKNLMRSVEGSLHRLDTDFIDLLWVHAWDFATPEEEVMRGLDDLVRAGKVHYIGVSDTPAWIVARANTLAELRGWTAFTGLQIEYNLLQRTVERELLPMARAMGLAVTPWAPLAGGALSGKYLRSETGRIAAESERRDERNTRIAQTVADIASGLGVSPAQVALNWLRQQGRDIIPIVGARRVDQLEDSLGCLGFALPPEAVAALGEVSAVEMGFPHEFLAREGIRTNVYGGTYPDIEGLGAG
jgi:aryl-alcohol dehydrogenase-like predicted oxidoreductase